MDEMAVAINSRSLGLSIIAIVLVLSSPLLAQSPVEARGTWRLTDGSEAGKWTGRGRFDVSKGGQLDGSMAIVGLPGFSQINLDGQLWNQRIQFGRMTRIEEAAEQRGDGPGTFNVTLSGVRIEGTFVTPEGVQGTWEGWWNVAEPTKAKQETMETKP